MTYESFIAMILKSVRDTGPKGAARINCYVGKDGEIVVGPQNAAATVSVAYELSPNLPPPAQS